MDASSVRMILCCEGCGQGLAVMDMNLDEELAKLRELGVRDLGYPVCCPKCAFIFAYDEEGPRKATDRELKLFQKSPTIMRVRHDAIMGT